jgi:hypothetical protein
MSFKIKTINVKDAYILFTSRILLATSFLSVTVFTLYSYRYRFHSDAATAGMIALEQWRTGQLFVPGWYYSQDFWPMFVLNSATVFFPLVHNAFLATQIGIFFQIVFIFTLTRKILISLGSTTHANLVLAFLLSGVSSLWSEFFYGQGQYGNVLMFILLETFFIIYLLKSDEKTTGKKLTVLALLFLSNVYINSTSVRYLPLFLAPALLALSFNFFQNKALRRGVTYIVFILLISTALGQLGLSWLKHSYLFLSGVDGTTIVSYHDAIADNLPRMLDGYLSLITDGAAGVKFASFKGCLFLFRLVFSFIFFSAPIYFLTSKYASKFKEFEVSKQYLVIYFCGLLFISLFSVIFLSSTVNFIAAARYIMVAVYFGVFVTVIFFDSLRIGNINKYLLVLITPIILFNIQTLNQGLAKGVGERDQLVNFLIENNLDRGFATYWNADVLTVLSDYKVMVSHIEGSHAGPSLFMSTKQFYKSVGAKENFLLLDSSEIASFDFNYLNKYLGSPDRFLKFNNYQIFVYKKEFASYLPEWF